MRRKTKQPKKEPERFFGVRVLMAGNLFFTRAYHRLTVETACPLPHRGPAILVCNHVSALDPLLVQSAVPHRLVIWMMAKEYYDIKPLGWVYRTVQAIPVARSRRDLAATRSALRALEDGRILGVFPEGKIETSTDLLPFQTGVALMAIKADVDVFPAYLDGTQRGKEMVEAVLSPNRARPLAQRWNLTELPPHGKALDVATEKIRQAVEGLRNQQRLGYNRTVV